MLRLSKKVFQKSSSSLEYILYKNKPINTQIFTPKNKPPEYEDESKPNPDYNQEHYND